MQGTSLPPSAASLFSHVTAEKAAVYRVIMEVFATAKRQFRLHLRPDEVLLEAHWPAERPALEEVQQALAQLVEWGNLQAQPDTARVASIEDFYRKRLLYRLSSGGEAVEAALRVFAATLERRELVWVLTSCYDLTREQVGQALEGLLRAKEIVLDRAEQVSQALRMFGASSADFADRLIERTAAAAGCEKTMTFDAGAAKAARMTLIT